MSKGVHGLSSAKLSTNSHFTRLYTKIPYLLLTSGAFLLKITRF